MRIPDQLTFLFNGVSALLGWTSVMSAFDYFQVTYPTISVSNYFPIPMFVAFLLVGLVFHRLQQHYSYSFMILFGLVLTNLTLVGMLLASIYLPTSSLGLTVCLVMCFLNGVAGNLTQLSFFAIINYMSEEIVGLFTLGASLGGLVIAFVRAAVLVCMGSRSGNVLAIMVYFAVGLLGNIFDLWLNLRFFSSPSYFKRVWPH